MNTKTDLIVIGAGFIGCMTALEAADSGKNIILLESENDILFRASQCGFGSLTPYTDPYFKNEIQKYAIEGVSLYKNKWLGIFEEILNYSIPFSNKGLIKLHKDTEAYNLDSIILDNKNMKHLTKSEIKKLEPWIEPIYNSGVWFNEPWISRADIVLAIKKLIDKSKNITLKTGKTISSIKSKKNDITVLTDNGEKFLSNYCVVATGLSYHNPIIGIAEQKLKWIRGDAISVKYSGEKILNHQIYMNNAFIAPTNNNELLLGATYEEEIKKLSKEEINLTRNTVSIKNLIKLVKWNSELLPSINKMNITRSWRGWRPISEDNLPIFGLDSNNIIIANGFAGLGVTMSPSVAFNIVKYINSNNDKVFLKVLSPHRFK